MTGALVPIIVTQDWSRPDDTTPTGVVTFQLLAAITAPGYVTPNVIKAPLYLGAIAQELVALDVDSGDGPITPLTQYSVNENVLGADAQDYFITVPAVPPGSRTITDGILVKSTQILISADAHFTDDDLNAYVLLEGYPPGTQIIEVIDGATVKLATSSPLDDTDVTVMIGASVTLQELRPS